jgi:hypothetical protein
MLPHAGQWTRRINNANTHHQPIELHSITIHLYVLIYRRLDHARLESFRFSNKTGQKVNRGCQLTLLLRAPGWTDTWPGNPAKRNRNSVLDLQNSEKLSHDLDRTLKKQRSHVHLPFSKLQVDSSTIVQIWKSR